MQEADVWGETDLGREDDDGGADEQHHEELARPDVRADVAVADRREGDDDEPQRVEQRELLDATALQMLYPADAAHARRLVNGGELQRTPNAPLLDLTTDRYERRLQWRGVGGFNLRLSVCLSVFRTKSQKTA